MSQFSQKYHNLNYKRNSTSIDKDEKVIWEFWHKWGLFEYAVIGLLLLILLCLCTMKSDFISTPLQKTQDALQTPQTKIKELTKNTQKGELLLGEKYPQKILPDSILPQESRLHSQKVYGPVTIEDYLYFVDATDTSYPDFIDEASGRVIKNKAPACFKPECPLKADTGNIFLSAYRAWASQQSQKDLQLIEENGSYFLHPVE